MLSISKASRLHARCPVLLSSRLLSVAILTDRRGTGSKQSRFLVPITISQRFYPQAPGDPSKRGWGYTFKPEPKMRLRDFGLPIGGAALILFSILDWDYIKEYANEWWADFKSRRTAESQPASAALTSEEGLRERMKRIMEKVKSKPENDPKPSGSSSTNDESPSPNVLVEEETKPKKKIGFRERKVIEYENRIRAFSTPDKIFRYFATLKVHAEQDGDFEVFMTPQDFVRSITPGIKQPEGYGLDKFRRFDPKREMLDIKQDEDSIFFKISTEGLISYPDFVFLLTVLSTSPKHYAMAFKMFDVNGDGFLDYKEFERVHSIIRCQTSMGSKHRDNAVTGSVLRHSTSSGLADYFFGADRTQKLSYETFLAFQQKLQNDMLLVEFQRRQPGSELMSNVEFAGMLLQHSNLPDDKQRQMRKRVRKLCKETPEACPGLSLAQMSDFFTFLKHINDVDVALTFFNMAGASVDQKTLKHVARTVSTVNVPDHVMNTVFVLFDENQDGELSNKEFVSVMKRRLMRGLENPKDTGLIKKLDALWTCAIEKTPEHHRRY